MSEADVLAVPEPARRDARSFEVLRVWLADGNQHVSLRAGVWEDPAAWGLMLADLARHIANAYEQEQRLTKAAVLERIKMGLDAELSKPTDYPKGRVT